jgi:hypothetical protein
LIREVHLEKYLVSILCSFGDVVWVRATTKMGSICEMCREMGLDDMVINEEKDKEKHQLPSGANDLIHSLILFCPNLSTT